MKVHFKNKLDVLKENEKSGQSQAGGAQMYTSIPKLVLKCIDLLIFLLWAKYKDIHPWLCEEITNKTTLKMQIMEDKIGNGPDWVSGAQIPKP